MRNRPTEEHREAVTRRLALLRAELALPPVGGPARAAAEPSPPVMGPLSGYPRSSADGDRSGADPFAGEPPTRVMEPLDPDPWWAELPVTEMALPSLASPTPGALGVPEVPVPGRHAARRSLLAEWLPATLRGRVGVGPWQLAVVAMVVAAGLAVTCWLVVRSDASVVPTTAAPATATGSVVPLVPLDTPGASPSGAAAGTVTVDVAGRVRQPGVLVLPAGSRVVDALQAAGGAKGGVDLGSLNQARVLVDGEQILVGATAPPVVTAAASGVPAPGALVNLNTATVDELDTLPEVGPVTAQSILDYRTEHGGFASVEELLDVDGIGEATLAKIAPHVTV